MMSFMLCLRIIVKVNVKFEVKICVRFMVVKLWYVVNNKRVFLMYFIRLYVGG